MSDINSLMRERSILTEEWEQIEDRIEDLRDEQQKIEERIEDIDKLLKISEKIEILLES